MRHIISILVEDKFGVLARVAGLFSGRGYNIESITVNVTERPEISLMTIVTHGDDKIIEQIVKQFVKTDSIVVDFSNFEIEKRGNAISFISGAAFALGGAVKKVGETTYLLSR